MKPDTVSIDKLSLETYTVLYRTKGQSLCQLQRLNRKVWGFVYLNRPYLEAVFLRPSAKESMLDAMKRHTLFSTPTNQLFKDIFNQIPNPSPKP